MIKVKSYSSFSCIGSRTNQEDYLIDSSGNNRVFVLCDGMGGHGHGEVASKTVAEAVYNYLVNINVDEFSETHLQDALDYAIKELANADIYDDEKSMGTTLVVVVINRMDILIGHVGDSRCYQFSNEGLKKFRTKDHSKVQEAIDAEILTEEEAWDNPYRNIITRCIQSSSFDVQMEVDKITVEDGDILLLCSDGVTDTIKDTQLQSLIIDRNIDDIADCIKNECELSSKDNFSAILIALSQDEVNLQPVNEINQGNSDESRNINMHGNDDCAFCSHCGNLISKAASFCPRCGKSVLNVIPPTPTIDGEKHSLKEILKKINPLWYIIGGTAIGGLLGWTFWDSHSSTNPYVEIPLKNDAILLNESQITSFIHHICEMDSTGLSSDSIILKSDLESQYQTFLDSLKNN